MKGDRHSALGGEQDCNTCRLPGRHRSLYIQLREDTLNGDDIGFHPRDPLIEILLQSEEPAIDLIFLRGSYHSRIDELERGTRTLNDADSTSSQTWIDTENAHPPRLTESGHDVVGDIEICIDVLDIVEIFDSFDEGEDPLGAILVERDVHRR